MAVLYRTSNNSGSFESMNDLLVFIDYNDIIWLKISDFTFFEKFVFPKNLQLIYIINCKNINFLNTLPDTITFVEIINCKATNINKLFKKEMKHVETINLSNNRLEEIPKNIPESTISLNLSENDIQKLPKTNCFSNTIKNINLSYNKLQDLPEWILELNEETTLVLMPNKFWFNSYSNITLNKPIYDYHISIANRFFDVSIANKLVRTRNIINGTEQRLNDDQQNFIIIDNQNHNITNKKTTAEQSQNVHNSDIQDSFSKSVKNIMDNPAPRIEKYLDKIWYYYILDGYNILSNIYFIEHIKNNCKTDTIVSRNGLTYGEIFERIWAISEIHIHKKEIRSILREEITSGMPVCFTGRVTRLVNSLTGFIEDVQIGISENEQINNTVIMIMRKHENNPDIDLHAEVKKALDELKINEEKQKIWLDAL